MLEFLRRQYIVGRTYALRNWCLGFAAIVSTALAFWGGVVATGYGLATGATWAWLPAMFCLTWYALNVARGYLRQATARLYFADRFPTLSGACRFDTWCTPFVALVNAGAMFASAVGTHITWRGNTYRIYQGGRIRLERKSEATRPAHHDLPHGVRIDRAQEVLDIFHAKPRERIHKRA
jgi:hypothetical protein